MSRLDFFLWVALPYLCLAIFVVGHVWRYRRDQYGWTARSTQLLERRLLMVGSLLFHFGILAAIGGHVLGILVPRSWTEAVGISDDDLPLDRGRRRHPLRGGDRGRVRDPRLPPRSASAACGRRPPAATSSSTRCSRPTILFGMLATVWGTAVDRYAYRETVSPWFRGIFTFHPHESLMANAPFLFQAHAVTAWLLLAIWPFTRLVHAWSVPVAYLGRAPILYRGRRGAAVPPNSA